MTIMDMKHKQTVDPVRHLRIHNPLHYFEDLSGAYYDWPYCSVVPDSYLISLFCQCYSPWGL